MKCFLTRLVRFVPVVVMIAMINVIVDPANIYKKGYEAKAAGLLLGGENVIGMTNYDERIFQEEFIKGEKKCPDTIILGSSRVMTLSDEVISDMGDYKNHGVSGAGIYDYLGILGVYEACNKLPEKVIIGLDPWILNENNGDTRYQSFIQYVARFEETLEGKRGLNIERMLASLEKEMQLLSVPYYQSSMKKLLKNPKEALKMGMEVDFYGTLEIESEKNIRYIDGSIEYGQEEREKSVEAVNDSARAYVAGNIYQMEEYNLLNKSYCTLLERTIDYLQEKEVEVIIYLPPYHPYVHQYLINTSGYHCFFEAEEYFLHLAEEKGIKVFGSYNPQLLGCTEEDFMDGMHMKRESVGKSWK